MKSSDDSNKKGKPDRIPLWIMGAIVLLSIWLIYYGR